MSGRQKVDLAIMIRKRAQFIIITYADENFRDEQRLFCRLNEGVADRLLCYGPADIPEPYKQFYTRLVALPHPFKEHGYMNKAAQTGYYFWKPVIIHHTLLKANSDDIIIYADARSRILRRSIKGEIDEILRKNDRSATPGIPIILAQNPWPLELVCLPIMFKLMNLDDVRYRHSPQWSAHAVILKNTKAVRDFMLKWIDNMMIGDGRILTDDSLPHPKATHRGEYQHSCNDQSIMNLTLLKENLSPVHCDSLIAWYRNVKDKYAPPLP
jgi:hypothetical protein